MLIGAPISGYDDVSGSLFDRPALDSMLAAWTAPATLDSRISAVTGSGSFKLLPNAGEVDQLTVAQGLEWFIGHFEPQSVDVVVDFSGTTGDRQLDVV
jgi:hypothetical protein